MNMGPGMGGMGMHMGPGGMHMGPGGMHMGSGMGGMAPGMGHQCMMGMGGQGGQSMGCGKGMGKGMGMGMPMGMGCPMMAGDQQQRVFSAADVRKLLDARLVMMGNDRLKLGEVVERDADTAVADVLTTDGSLVQRLEVDRRTMATRPLQ
ncbi:MAG: hypothetical protein HQL38_01760 [Alphaproteobacteria bacterium]|nr:hypothetical protein [Alphaproteobacteria bacterium]